MTPNLVSIITPAYNSEAFIEGLIQNVQQQTYQQWELLVVMDKGTTDRTPDIVLQSAARDPRVKLIQIKDGKGLALSRNRALREAQGQYIAFLDSDDLWMPEKLSHQLSFMQKHQAAFSCTAFRRINYDHSEVGKLIRVPEEITYEKLLINNWIGCLTVLVDQSQTGPLQMKETKHEDFLLWLEILNKGFKCYGLNEDLARYRIVPNSRSANKLEMIKYRWKILREYENQSLVNTSKYLFLYALTSLKKHGSF